VRGRLDLHRADGKGHALQQGVQELDGGRRGGPSVGLKHSQRETTSRAVNCLKTTPGRGRTSKVSTCTRSPGRETAYCLGLRMASRAQSAAIPGDAAAGCFDQSALSLQLDEDAAQHGGRDREVLLTEQDGKLVLAPARVAQP
jgi:hypothetical protein